MQACFELTEPRKSARADPFASVQKPLPATWVYSVGVVDGTGSKVATSAQSLWHKQSMAAAASFECLIASIFFACSQECKIEGEK